MDSPAHATCYGNTSSSLTWCAWPQVQSKQEPPVTAQGNDYDVSLDATRIGFFETPVVVAKLKNPARLIADLEAAIRARMATHAGLERSNIGGWHSDTRMLDWGGVAAKRLVDQAASIAQRLTHLQEHSMEGLAWSVQMWANVSGPGALNHMHVHPGNLWSAVFYVDAGVGEREGDAVGGELYFEDPRFPEAAMHTTAFRFVGADGKPLAWQADLWPEPGMLVVFPSWLRHGVRPYRGDGERISIAINLNPRLS